MIRIVLALTIVIAGANGAAAATIMGSGTLSCGNWVRDSRQAGFQDTVSRSWLVGFLSGYNVASGGADILADPNLEGLALWMNNYCKSNPLDDVVTAARALARELQSRAERK